MIYLHDGTFNGLLTCVYAHYYDKEAEGIYSERTYELSLVDEKKRLETDIEKAKKVYNAIMTKISDEAMSHVYHTFLSSDYHKDCYLLRYLQLGFKMGYKIDYHRTHQDVIMVHKLSAKVAKERHLFLGTLRFQEVGKGLYAPLAPDHDIIELLASHFADRLKQEQFIIHDRKRNKAVIYNTKAWFITEFTYEEEVKVSEREKQFQDMWKGYFEHISIKERENLRLQRQFVPVRYRQHIVEFGD